MYICMRMSRVCVMILCVLATITMVRNRVCFFQHGVSITHTHRFEVRVQVETRIRQRSRVHLQYVVLKIKDVVIVCLVSRTRKHLCGGIQVMYRDVCIHTDRVRLLIHHLSLFNQVDMAHVVSVLFHWIG